MLICLLLSLILSSTLPPLGAQEADEIYENPELGLAFALPSGWEVRESAASILAASPEALNVLDGGGTPDELVVRIILGSFVDMNIPNAAALPEQLARLVPSGITAPDPLETPFGDLSGWEIEYSSEASNLSTQVGLVALADGRLALVRGFSSLGAWEAAKAEYAALKASLVFSTPANLADPLAGLPDEDGGVLWQYQEGPANDGFPPVTLGGVAFDPFLLIYAAAGPRGVLVLDQTNGAFTSYLGPLFNDDNFVDLAISADARLYVANATPGDNNQVMIVNRAGGFEYGFGSTGEGPGQFAPGMPQTIAVTRGREPKIWTVSEGHSTPPARRLYQFDRFGNLLQNIDLDAINPDLANIRLDNNLGTGALYLVGREGGGINVLDGEGRPLATRLALELFSLSNPLDIAIAPSGNIVVATDTLGFFEFAPSGVLLDRFGIPYSPAGTDDFRPGEVLRPNGLMVDAEGVIFFTETHPTNSNSQIQAFRFAGDGLLPLPSEVAEEGDINHNTLALDPAAGGGDIEYGAVVQGSLNNNYPSHSWYFEGRPGDVIRITLRDISGDAGLDTLVRLLDPNQVEIAEVDDLEGAPPEGFKPTDSIIEIELRAFGFYTLQAARFGGRGDYELTLELVGP
jgi:hypothetical protein